MFIGQNAKTYNPHAVTGFGPEDGQPRNEISDHACRINLTQDDIENLSPYDDSKGNFIRPRRKMRLEQLLEHDELYKAYPGLRRAPVTLGWPLYCGDANGLTAAGTLDGDFTLVPWSRIPPWEVQKNLLHEIQHEVQAIEGFTPGSNQHAQMINVFLTLTQKLAKRQQRAPSDELALKSVQLRLAWRAENSFLYGDMLRDLPGVPEAREQMMRRAARLYMKVPGEIEAYTTAERSELTPEQRLETPASCLVPTVPEKIIKPDAAEMHAALRRNGRRATMANVSDAFNSLLVRAKLRPAIAPAHTP